ncbi:DmsC/YnfH family molybdoenzyme membrane anchor subunit [Caviibacterium pharyngocola]|uniref:Dimethyl sulfoxide reductase n=1 Tax=Caviibacterium pharyngocola TaxID=28159 RepID=A0A2M8RU85_9PAST|nr:DmsC/YnfH family molybdoenzyme membrane anchor subunit [Caviibacterium pharyngocola]PJG82456.1 dimethyl sulfoxide reductase [Caviibacterium pharyngocola]
MNAGLHELPLILFTVLAQSAVGSVLVFAFALFNTQNTQSRNHIHKAMFVLLALLGIGFLSSVMHLGSPLRAFNSLNRVGESMLSNEIASGSAFFAVAGLYWLCAILNKLPTALGKVWIALAAIVGLVFMWMMANLYRIPTVPTWDTVLTPISFYLTLVAGGLSLAYALLQPNRHKEYCLKWLPWAYLVGVLLIAITAVYQGVHIGSIQSSAQQAAALVPDFAQMTALRLCLLGVAATILFKGKSLPLLTLAFLLTFVAEFIGRTLFYGLHMTVGTAFGG